MRQSVSSSMKIGPRTGSDFLVMGKANGSLGTGIRLIPYCWAFLAQPKTSSDMIAPEDTLHWTAKSNAEQGS